LQILDLLLLLGDLRLLGRDGLTQGLQFVRD
jgi:hypothetical protein